MTCQCFRGRALIHTKWTGIILSGWPSVARTTSARFFFVQKKRYLLHCLPSCLEMSIKKWMLCEDNTVLTNSMRTVKGECFLGSDLQSSHFNGMKTTSRFGWTGHRQAARWLFFLMPVWFQLHAWRIMQKIYEASVWVLFGIKPFVSSDPIVQKLCSIETSNKSVSQKTRFPSETFFFCTFGDVKRSGAEWPWWWIWVDVPVVDWLVVGVVWLIGCFLSRKKGTESRGKMVLGW